MTTLDNVLSRLGYESRPQQRRLYEVMRDVDPDGVIVQAGTGTGKSLAILSAAVDLRLNDGLAVAVSTPTKVLMDQYVTKDVPAVQQVSELRFASLKGRLNYLCSSSPAMRRGGVGDSEARLVDHYTPLLYGDEIIDGVPPRFGCRGTRRHKKDTICHAVAARMRALEADIIVTNLHVLILDRQFRQLTGEGMLLPELCATFVDEAHMFEGIMRDFTEVSISNFGLMKLHGGEGVKLEQMMQQWNRARREFTVEVTPELVCALVNIAEGRQEITDDDDEDNDPVPQAASKIIWMGQNGLFQRGDAVLHFIPSPTERRSCRLVATRVNLAHACRDVLTATGVGLVSATIPQTMPSSIGLWNARLLDVGHPFDYSRQGTIKFSNFSGSYKAAQDDVNFNTRVRQLLNEIRGIRGGVLLLFSAMSDLRKVYDAISESLRQDGRLVLKQDDGVDKRELARAFIENGHAILFGSESFATGFDVPGSALEMVGIWKLPYPALDPVTNAISRANYRRYEDMMLVRVAQAAGRPIRSHTDTGVVFIVDSRGRGKLLGSRDPLIAHLSEFRYAEPVHV